MKIPQNNTDLYEYLVSLSQNLERRGKEALNKRVKQAIRAAATLNPIVFMGETRVVLQYFIEKNSTEFMPEEIERFKAIQALIEDAFAKHKQRSLDSYKK